MPTDRELYAAWVDGDRVAANELVDRHLAALRRFFANKLPNESDADELTADTFERCAGNLGSFRGESSFRTFLFAIARNVLRRHLRDRFKQPELDLETTALRDLSPSPSSVAARRREHRLLLAALRSIPLDHQIVLELSFFEDLPRAEIAVVLDIPSGTVASRLRRARALLEEAVTASSRDTTVGAEADELELWIADLRTLLHER